MSEDAVLAPFCNLCTCRHPDGAPCVKVRHLPPTVAGEDLKIERMKQAQKREEARQRARVKDLRAAARAKKKNRPAADHEWREYGKVRK